jgi:hypothetical protein
MSRSIAKLKHILNNAFEVIVMTLAILTLAFVTAQIVFGASVKQKSFAAPDEGVRALIEAARSNDTKALFDILGLDAKAFIQSGDPVSDRESWERFIKFYEESSKLLKSGDTKVVLQVGKDEWPFPIPLVKSGTGWIFDSKEGKEEIVNRRIGRNELDVIQVCLAYVDAQREYYQRNPQDDPLLQYAQKFLSTAGKRDGLYWEAKADEPPSPFGPLVTQARGAGYKGAGGKPVPYHGYYYRILTGQGPNAPDGAYDYTVRGKMIGGFGMVAHPRNTDPRESWHSSSTTTASFTKKTWDRTPRPLLNP